MLSRRTWWSGLLALAAVASIAGCSSEQKVLANAVYAKDVPVFRGASFEETSGSESWGDDPDSYTKGTVWWFKTKASQAQLLAFYQNLYPNAEVTELETGGVQLRIVPAGALNFEDVTIMMKDGDLRIGEDVRPQNLKKSAVNS
jgi:hypothetical protein